MNLVKFLGHLIKSAEAPCSADGEMVYLIPIFFFLEINKNLEKWWAKGGRNHETATAHL